MTLVFIVVFAALVFEYINGFHDTANSIAMGVSTRALTPRFALAMAATMNLIGALVGTAVAKTISSGLVSDAVVPKGIMSHLVISALVGAIIWNLITWWFGLPSSSSHALVGGVVGAALAATHGNWDAIIWLKPGLHWWDSGGVIGKVIIPMVLSPIFGFFGGMVVMTFFYVLVQKWRPSRVDRVFRMGQLFSGSYMGFSHGSNDAQKTMGIIALTLVAATDAGSLDGIPSFLSFLKVEDLGHDHSYIPVWIKVTCATVMAAGTAAGGWRIIRTMGQKMVRVLPINGFAADATGATVLMTAAHFGMPVSTTHAITTSIMGVGCARRWSALKLSVVWRIVLAWVLTLPMAALISWLTMRGMHLAGWAGQVAP
jgi:inorganic phosphate transporter, PiT family